ncbi:rod shape-determining protein MreC [Denitrobaculum tricleocarpae]|uniref:Cell shape-determining protein MreC n=1 Tax=Denitrobaculum tricleocarpae TaxID=2591009 RepID=A0A545TY17_9PROT|nr:rod shape-determining protein MreC [Denitrobaculum tricleocarpae]TQV82084.1 rod shape-determining protein MreC [Denitrobaculum tricleocarpae]
MSKRSGNALGLATPIRAWAQRSAFVFFFALAIVLLVLGRAQTPAVERVRTAVNDAVAPVLELATSPVATVSDTIVSTRELFEVRAANEALRQENQRLLQWRAAAQRLEDENRLLRDLNQLTIEPRTRYITARVIGDQGGAFVRSVLVSAGARDGVEKGQAALTGRGLAGRVAETGRRAARILLVTDMNSRVPVLVGNARDRAVLAGDNSPNPELLYFSPGVQIRVGDRVVTSGHGGAFPSGLPIGVVTDVRENDVRVEPYVDWSHLEFLRLVDYELPSILNSPEDGLVKGKIQSRQAAPVAAASGPNDAGSAAAAGETGTAGATAGAVVQAGGAATELAQ